MLRIHQLSLLAVDPEKGGVKEIKIRHEATPFTRSAVPLFTWITVKLFPIPAFRWDLGNRVNTLLQVAPELF
ncbi:hypothetical protein N9118_00540 [Akkermansiaceae bacterium]|nr:hypothetical protein [Akkermansiaceae bacterium]